MGAVVVRSDAFLPRLISSMLWRSWFGDRKSIRPGKISHQQSPKGLPENRPDKQEPKVGSTHSSSSNSGSFLTSLPSSAEPFQCESRSLLDQSITRTTHCGERWTPAEGVGCPIQRPAITRVAAAAAAAAATAAATRSSRRRGPHGWKKDRTGPISRRPPAAFRLRLFRPCCLGRNFPVPHFPLPSQPNGDNEPRAAPSPDRSRRELYRKSVRDKNTAVSTVVRLLLLNWINSARRRLEYTSHRHSAVYRSTFLPLSV